LKGPSTCDYFDDWSAENATKGLMGEGGFMKMLHKDHIYVVQGYMTYICLIKFNNIYMLFKNIYTLLNIYVV